MDQAAVAQIVRGELARSDLARNVRALQGQIYDTTLTMIVGSNLFTLAGIDTTRVQGLQVLNLQAASHWTFTWFPVPLAGGIVFNNTGASQSVTIRYRVT